MKKVFLQRTAAMICIAVLLAGCGASGASGTGNVEAAETAQAAGTVTAGANEADAAPAAGTGQDAAPAEQAADSTDAVEKAASVMPLPPAEAGLKTVVAEKWLQVSDEPVGSMEGLCFAPDGSLYFVMGTQVCRVTPPEKDITVVYDSQGEYFFTSCDIHKDGRIFCSDIAGGRLVCIQPDGSSAEVVAEGIDHLDDICFDRDGNAYATQLIGEYRTREIGEGTACVYKFSPDFSTKEVLFSGYYGSNGVFFSPDYKYLYTTEFFNNRLIRSQLDENWEPLEYYGAMPIYTFSGECGPDSVYVDAQGQVYQPLWGQGRFLIMDYNGTPFMNVLVPEREKYMRTAGVAIMPGTNTAYCCGLSDEGAAIFTFEAPGTGSETFAFQK